MSTDTFLSILWALVFHLYDFVSLVTFVSIMNFFQNSIGWCFCDFNIMVELRSHKRGRSLDLHLCSNSENKFITTTSEAEIAATTSDSEYDSDVIVVGKGQTGQEFHECHPIIVYHRCALWYYPLHQCRM
jgi:hypothetical protein